MEKLIAAFISIILFIIPSAHADTIYLKNGRQVEGLIKAEDEDSVKIDIGFGTVGFTKTEIEKIYRSTPEEIAAIYQKWQRQNIAREKAWQEEKIKRDLLREQQPRQVDVSWESGHIFVEAILNRKVPAQLLMDTGASLIVLSKNMGEKLKIKPKDKNKVVQLQLADGRKIEATRIILEKIKVQDVEVKDVEAAVLQEEVAEANFKDGLLGMSFLNRFNFKVDYKKGKLILEKR